MRGHDTTSGMHLESQRPDEDENVAPMRTMACAACTARSKRANQRVTQAVAGSGKAMPALDATHTAGSERMPSPPGVVGVATMTGISWGKAPVATLNSGAALPGIENVMNAWGCVGEVWTFGIVAAEYGGMAAVSTTRTKRDRVGGGRQFELMHRRHGSGCARPTALPLCRAAARNAAPALTFARAG